MANRDFSKPFSGFSSEVEFPRFVKRGDKNATVKRVQEWLVYYGHRLTIDGEFGPMTEATVKAFEAANHLTIDGIVDVGDWHRLTAPLHRAMAPIDGTGKTVNDLVVAYAKQHVAEHPVEIGGPNAGPFVRAYMLGGDGKWALWCAGFVSYVLAQACGAKGVPLPFRPSFGATELARYAKAKNRFSADGPAVPGDVFVIPDADGKWFHTGFVIEWRGTEKFVSIEGNTNRDGGSDGEVARSALRNPARCDFLRVGP